jgi:hypothetical protein
MQQPRRGNQRNLYKSKKMALELLIDDIIVHIKAFDGDIYGGVIRDYKISNNTYIKDINCRVDVFMFSAFLNTLHLHFDVTDYPKYYKHQFINIIKSLQIRPKYSNISNTSDTNDVSVTLEIIVMTRAEWMRLPCDFDINLFAENSQSRYIRAHYNVLDKYVDILTHVNKRIKAGQFALLEPTSNKTASEVLRCVDKARRLVTRGWMMDDSTLMKNSWVINSWYLLQSHAQECRRSYEPKQIEQMQLSCECSVCNETFNRMDIVINTKCNHNFHWNSCTPNSSRCLGLREWVRLGNMTCPLCREQMF